MRSIDGKHFIITTENDMVSILVVLAVQFELKIANMLATRNNQFVVKVCDVNGSNVAVSKYSPTTVRLGSREHATCNDELIKREAVCSNYHLRRIDSKVSCITFFRTFLFGVNHQGN